MPSASIAHIAIGSSTRGGRPHLESRGCGQPATPAPRRSAGVQAAHDTSSFATFDPYFLIPAIQTGRTDGRKGSGDEWSKTGKRHLVLFESLQLASSFDNILIVPLNISGLLQPPTQSGLGDL